MKKIIRWFLKLIRPNKERFVQNIQQSRKDTASGKKDYATESFKKKHSDDFFFMETSNIVSILENKSGKISQIKSKTAFSPLVFDQLLRLKSQKFGLSSVKHEIEAMIGEENKLINQYIDRNCQLSILHVDEYGTGFLYGKKKGLNLTKKENGALLFSGKEDDVFYELSENCLEKILESVKKESE